jgi:hypothetical protein
MEHIKAGAGGETGHNDTLSTVDAVIAMARDKETLYDEDGLEYFWDDDDGCFCSRQGEVKRYSVRLPRAKLQRKQPEQEQEKTNYLLLKFLSWLRSEESVGWFVRWLTGKGGSTWWVAAHNVTIMPDSGLESLEICKLRWPGIGIDESTIQKFKEVVL